MASNNDETMWAIPSIQCPSCGYTIDMSGPKIGKLSRRQKKEILQSYGQGTTSSYQRQDHQEMESSEMPEHTFVMVSCSNFHCEQYNRFKVLRIPKISTPGVKVSLE